MVRPRFPSLLAFALVGSEQLAFMEGQVKDEKALTGVHGTRNLRMEIYGDTVLGVQSKLSDAKLAVLHDTPTRSHR
jgi:hypothetical protein